MRIALQLLGVVLAVLLTGAMLGTAGWVLPPVQSEQVGFRGTGMVQVHSPKAQAALLARNEAPAPQDPAPPGGEPATKTYQNVQVLTDLCVWVSPFALYPSGGAGAVLLSGVMCFFFSGILEMCKSLLDPYGTRRVSNFNFCTDIQVNVLLAETNSGLVSWPRRLLAIHDANECRLPMSVPLAVAPLKDPWEDDVP